ncbi:MAG: cobalamin B12-binding domain-containing protein [Verrucomicrobiota bacterium]
MNAHHSMKVAAQRTGLSPHVIRVWERRYRAVSPARTGSRRRLYSDEELERLLLLRQATERGHSIGDIAALPSERLRALAGETGSAAVRIPGAPLDEGRMLDEAVAAVQKMDAAALNAVLQRGSVRLGTQGLLLRVIGRMVHDIGERWRRGEMTAAHEHFASAVIRTFLSQSLRGFSDSVSAPVLIVSTPPGQLHELGALLAGAVASGLGWQVAYLGPSLPAAEIAGAAVQKHARGVALSLVYPEDDHRLPAELERLRELLPAEIPIVAGGRAGRAYARTLAAIGAERVEDLDQLERVLESWRRPQPQPA